MYEGKFRSGSVPVLCGCLRRRCCGVYLQVEDPDAIRLPCVLSYLLALSYPTPPRLTSRCADPMKVDPLPRHVLAHGPCDALNDTMWYAQVDGRLLAALRVMFTRSKKEMEGKTAGELSRYKVCNKKHKMHISQHRSRVFSEVAREN